MNNIFKKKTRGKSTAISRIVFAIEEQRKGLKESIKIVFVCLSNSLK